MKILFIHQNMPAQYRHLAQHYAKDEKNEVVFITQAKGVQLPGVKKIEYRRSRNASESTHTYLRELETYTLNGQGVARSLMELRKTGFVPDIVMAHPGWGEAMFVKDIYPATPLLIYCEFFYRSRGADVGFDPQFPLDVDRILRLRCRTSHHLISLEAADWGISPTRWQWQQHPEPFRPRISVIHDGVNTDKCQPNPDVTFELPTGLTLSRADEVVTYVARNLEPYRGFHKFMPALAELCKRRPDTRFLIVGGDEVSYGSKPSDADCWREKMLSEVEIDPLRVHFLGRLAYEDYLKVLQISRAHIYLTYPFVLSWSMIEAMSCGCPIVGSSTAPVQEVIKDGHNGLLCDFFNPTDIADKVVHMLENPDDAQRMGAAARKVALKNFDLQRVCLPAQLKLIDAIVKKKPIPKK